MKKIIYTNDKYEFSLLEGTIIRILVKSLAMVTEEDLAKNKAAIEKYFTKPKMPFIVIFDENVSVEEMAHNTFSKPERSYYKNYEAFVVKSLTQRLLAKSIIDLHPVEHERKLFFNEEKALAWIREKLAAEN